MTKSDYAKFLASEAARTASILERDALTNEELYELDAEREAEAEFLAERASERYWEDWADYSGVPSWAL